MVEIMRLTESSARIAEDLSALASELRGEPNTFSGQSLQTLLAEPNTIIIVAHDADHIVGMATLCITPRIGKRTALLEDVVVLEKYRGQGIGEMLMRRVIETARDNRVGRIQLTSRASRIAAHKLYEKVGFEKYETDVFRISLKK